MQTRITGVVLIVIGIIMLVYTGFNYTTTKRVVDIGPVKINKEESHRIQWPPVIGTVLIVGGIIILARDKKAGT
jgi:uncharacterized membrane protein YdcZ (DUF606 family)